MASALLFIVCSSASFLLSALHPVEGLVTQPQNFDLSVVNVTRIISEDFQRMFVSVNFTASREPQVQWTHAGPNGETVVINGTEVKFGGYHGQAIASFDSKIMVVVKIGYFDTQFLRIFLRWNSLEHFTSQTLNTVSTSVSSGYNITYTSTDEAFQVTASVPREIGEGFTWSHYLDDVEREYDVRLYACYVDQKTGRVLSSVDHLDDPDMSAFLLTGKTYEDNGATWTLSFNTSREDISGYFEFFTLYDHFNYDNDDADQFVIHIWESVFVKVHDDTTPGPFPVGFKFVRASSRLKWCRSGEHCAIYCYGYSNDIVAFGISKDGKELEALDRRIENSNHVSFDADIDTSLDFAGRYVCWIRSRDGTEGEETIAVIEE